MTPINCVKTILAENPEFYIRNASISGMSVLQHSLYMQTKTGSGNSVSYYEEIVWPAWEFYKHM